MSFDHTSMVLDEIKSFIRSLLQGLWVVWLLWNLYCLRGFRLLIREAILPHDHLETEDSQKTKK